MALAPYSQAVKQIIKDALPRKVLNAAVDMRELRRLNATPIRAFDSSRLRAVATFLGSPSIPSDRATGDLWSAVDNEMRGVFPGDHVAGGINPGDRRALFYLVSTLKTRKVLEIGTHVGASTLYIAAALKHISRDATVTTVDILDVNHPEDGAWKQLGLAMPPVAAADRLGYADHIIFKSSSALAFMADTEEKFDLVFLDGDHAATAVYREVSTALQLLNDNGVILLHDYYPDARPLFSDGTVYSGPYRALQRIIRENPRIAVRPLGALPWETKLGSHMTSLAVVARC